MGLEGLQPITPVRVEVHVVAFLSQHSGEGFLPCWFRAEGGIKKPPARAQRSQEDMQVHSCSEWFGIILHRNTQLW